MAAQTTRRDMLRALLCAGAGVIGSRAFAESANTMPAIASRKIPATGESLPVIGLGTWQTFDVASDAPAKKAAADTLRAFVDRHLRVIDTSPMYGSAEAVVGELLEPLDPQRSAFIATKVWTSGAGAGRSQIDSSFRLLRRERLDLIQVHNLLDAETQLATLMQLKHEGRVRYVGVSHYTASAHAELVRYVEKRTIDFVQVNYSLLEREAENTVLPAAAANGVAVLINRPLAEGAILARVRGRALPALASELGATSWAQLALKWIIGHPAVTCVIPGTRNPAHLLDNVAAAAGVMPDAALRAKISAALDAR